MVKKRLGQTIADQTEAFKHAYVAEAIKVSGNTQFHMQHKDYSDHVRDVLDKMGGKLKVMAGGACSIAKDKVSLMPRWGWLPACMPYQKIWNAY